MSGPRRSIKQQHVHHLHVGETQADLLGGLRVEEDGRGDELANFEHDAVGCGHRSRNQGRMVYFGRCTAAQLSFHSAYLYIFTLYRGRADGFYNKSLQGNGHGFTDHPGVTGGGVGKLNSLQVKAGKVRPVIDKSYRLSEGPEAIWYLEQRPARGKVVITFGS